VTNRTAATRYARALLDVARSEHADLARIESELAGFASLLSTHAELERMLLNPAVPTPRKSAAIAAILAVVKPLPVVDKLLRLLAGRDRVSLIADIHDAYHERLMDLQNVVRASVTTAVALDPAKAKAIETSLARATGRSVVLSTKVDPAIIGGIVARVGSVVYDGSIATHLQRLKTRLGESV
jgi:F-type H+-transporting ATPase subunit delta